MTLIQVPKRGIIPAECAGLDVPVVICNQRYIDIELKIANTENKLEHLMSHSKDNRTIILSACVAIVTSTLAGVAALMIKLAGMMQ
jgi:hypothetical protein